ncbi:MAG: 50S ribosomal protein L18 [Candidatus Hodarchaeota archaeon]
MAQGPTYKVKFRRRREGKTNYYRRQRLLRSQQTRLVIRKTNTKTIVQFVNANVIGDTTVASATSPEIGAHGWSAGTSNLPSAYLTGYLAGLRAEARGVKEAVLDVGLHPPVRGSRIYAALKGVIDAGIDIPYKPEVLPDEDRITGEHIVNAFKYYSENPNNSYAFSKIGKKKTNITGIPRQFKATKDALNAIPAATLKKKSKRKKPAAKKATPAAKKPKKEKVAEKPPRAVPRKPKPKKLISRGKGKKRKRGK